MPITIPHMPNKTVFLAPHTGCQYFDTTAQVIATVSPNMTYAVNVADMLKHTGPVPADMRTIMDYRIIDVCLAKDASAPKTTKEFHTELAISAILHFANKTAEYYGLTAHVVEHGAERAEHIYLNCAKDPDNAHIIYEIVLEQDENDHIQVKFGTRNKNDLASLYGENYNEPDDDPYKIAVATALLHAVTFYDDNQEIPF